MAPHELVALEYEGKNHQVSMKELLTRSHKRLMDTADLAKTYFATKVNIVHWKMYPSKSQETTQTRFDPVGLYILEQ